MESFVLTEVHNMLDFGSYKGWIDIRQLPVSIAYIDAYRTGIDPFRS